MPREQNWQLRQGEEYGKTTGKYHKAAEIDSDKEMIKSLGSFIVVWTHYVQETGMGKGNVGDHVPVSRRRMRIYRDVARKASKRAAGLYVKQSRICSQRSRRSAEVDVQPRRHQTIML
jgi:hypothetical protein